MLRPVDRRRRGSARAGTQGSWRGAPTGPEPCASVEVVRVAFGTDESTPVTAAMVAMLEAAGHQVDPVAMDLPWPEVGHRVGRAVASGRADRGVVCCWTGTGVSIAANKVPGVRAALCTDAVTAAGARRYNDANVVAVGLRLTTAEVAGEILRAFLDTPVDDAERASIALVEGPIEASAVGGGEPTR
jgi:ribose 5-phosphate isomerase B